MLCHKKAEKKRSSQESFIASLLTYLAYPAIISITVCLEGLLRIRVTSRALMLLFLNLGATKSVQIGSKMYFIETSKENRDNKKIFFSFICNFREKRLAQNYLITKTYYYTNNILFFVFLGNICTIYKNLFLYMSAFFSSFLLLLRN